MWLNRINKFELKNFSKLHDYSKILNLQINYSLIKLFGIKLRLSINQKNIIPSQLFLL